MMATKRYENERTDVLLEALECATRDREDMQASLASSIPNFWKLPREQALALMSEEDRDYFLEIGSYLRDFATMEKSLRKKKEER